MGQAVLSCGASRVWFWPGGQAGAAGVVLAVSGGSIWVMMVCPASLCLSEYGALGCQPKVVSLLWPLPQGVEWCWLVSC